MARDWLQDGPISEQRFDQRTIGAGSVAALRDDIFQHALHAFQVCDLRAHIRQVRHSESAGFGARLFAFIRQP